jgi:hypothetical protein
MIVSPTRELALQIFEVLRNVGGHHQLSAGLITGYAFIHTHSHELCIVYAYTDTATRYIVHTYYCTSSACIAALYVIIAQFALCTPTSCDTSASSACCCIAYTACLYCELRLHNQCHALTHAKHTLCNHSGKRDFEEEQVRVSRMNILVATPGRLLQHLEQTPGFDATQLQVRVLLLHYYSCAILNSSFPEALHDITPYSV